MSEWFQGFWSGVAVMLYAWMLGMLTSWRR